MSRADEYVEVRLSSFLQFFVSPGIDRPGMFEFEGGGDEPFDGLSRMFGRLDLRPFLRGEEAFDLCAKLGGIGFITPSGKLREAAGR